MKTSKQIVTIGFVIAAACGIGFGSWTHNARFVVHEWGTFTSVQGGDGKLLSWRPLETSKLPRFVYNWRTPGLQRSRLSYGKGDLAGLQRMETPVLYFYSDRPRSADVSVAFPNGTLTEWYPQAAQIGPATVTPSSVISSLDGAVHKLGASNQFTFAKFVKTAALPQSRIHWADVHVLATDEVAAVGPNFLKDNSGSHYFAARDTDANPLRIDSLERTNWTPETEKFLFYRGVGSFGTPLVVTADVNENITISNAGPQTLLGLIVLHIEGQGAAFVSQSVLRPGQAQRCVLPHELKPVSETAKAVRAGLEKSLIAAGLYQKEAQAMVNTWQDSWLAEEGVRVLYILPRAWTDQTLPITVSPIPNELVRVMVGRAEVIPPAAQKRLHDLIVSAPTNAPDPRVSGELKRFGRFAEPALQLALRDVPPAQWQGAWAMLAKSSPP